jgi:glutaredoxin-related protein
MVKHANKVIISDVTISDAVFLFLKYRDNENKMYIENLYKKYDGINAIRIRNEQMLLDELFQHI